MTAAEHRDAAARLRDVLTSAARAVPASQESGAIDGVRDALTGLANRSLVLEALGGALARMARTGRGPAVMFCDLDGFKAVNDGFGHEAGDRLLIEVAHRFVECVRGTDIVARFGGDEFVVVLEDVHEVDDAVTVAERILARVAEPIVLDGGHAQVSASIGIALAHPFATTADDLLAEADAAMYRAKRTGKHRYQVFDDDLRTRLEERAELRHDLEGALARDELMTVFTPVVRSADGRLSMLEAALRWKHPERGMLGAAEFMPLARKQGLARRLDRHALVAAASAARGWNAVHDRSVPVTVWVTVGVQDLLAGELQSFVAQLVEDEALGPGSLGIEVQLANLNEHPKQAESALQSIAWHGVRVAVDDFGADLFSPMQLQRFHVDTVKLDRRLLRAAGSAPEALSALAAVVALARALGLAVVAKGVDSREQLELLQELGCELVQGDVVATAQPAGAVSSLLEAAPPWANADWPRVAPLGAPLTRSQLLERLMRLHAAA